MNANFSSSMIPDRRAEGLSRQARHFFGVSLLAIGIATLLTWLMCRYLGRPTSTEPILFPKAFAFSTILLFFGSYSLNRSIQFVRIEKQAKFRFWLVTGLVTGALFMGIQSYGLWSMFPPQRAADEASRGVSGFVLCLATLHGLHFLIAVLFVAFVLARTFADRYDHEYYWGVRYCAWFWHFLGIVWMAILAVIAIAL